MPSPVPLVRFQGRMRQADDIARTRAWIGQHFPDTTEVVEGRLRLNTHPHFFQVDTFRQKLAAFWGLTGDSLAPLLSALRQGVTPVEDWFLLARMPSKTLLSGWLDIHPDLTHGGPRRGQRFERKTVPVSDTEALTRIRLVRNA